jgi:nucleoside-diphosphate-sugar epimerase
MPYGRLKPEDLPVKETHPLSPLDMYSIHKVTGEAYMRMYHDQHGLDTTVLRLTNPFGPRAQVTNPAYCVVNWMVRQAMEGKPLKIFGDGVQRRDFVYIGDVVDAMVIAGLHPSAKGETFNIGSGVATPFRDMVHIISEQNGDNPVECVEWPANYKAVETGDFAADVSKARRVLGWSAKTSLQEGLEITRKFYESNRSHYFI